MESVPIVYCHPSTKGVYFAFFFRLKPSMVYAVNPQRTKVLEEIRHELYIAAIYVGQNNPKIDAVKQLVRPALVCGPQFSNVAKIFPSNVATGLVR